MEIVKQAEAIGMTAIFSPLSHLRPPHQFSQFVSASPEERRHDRPMIYKSAIEDGTADVLLDAANACDIAEAEGVGETASSRCTGSEEWSLILASPPSYREV